MLVRIRHLLLLFFSLIFLPPTSADEVCSLGKTAWNLAAPARFGLSASLRKVDQLQPLRCGIVSQEVLQMYVAAQWVCDRLNADLGNGSFVPGVQFGFDLLDDCRSPTRAVQYALDYADLYDDCQVPDNSTSVTQQLRLGVVGPTRSSTAEETADATRSIPLPIISPSATLATLTQGGTPHPNFFRTVPSDKLQMKAIVAVLKRFYWTFVAVVYTDDNYGAMGSRLLKEEARKVGVCVNHSIPISSQTSMVSVVSELVNEREKADGGSMAVVYIGDKDKAENLIFNVRSLKAHGLHFIMSDGVSTNVEVFDSGHMDTGTNIALGSFTLAPFSVIIQEFQRFLNQRYSDVKEGRLQDDVIKSYLEESGLMKSSARLEPVPQIAFVPPAVGAMYALAEATRQVHLDRCGGVPGVCLQMVTAVREGDILRRLRTIQVDFGAMDSFRAPEEFKRSGYVLEFDENGDVIPKPQLPDYTIFAYTDNTGAASPYTQVGSFTGEQLTLDLSSVRFLTRGGTVSTEVPTSVCEGLCAECADTGKIPLAHINGSAYIIGIFSLHERNAYQPFKCGDFRNVSNDAVVLEAFLYAVQQLKIQTGIDFGAVAFDDCYSSLHITSVLSDFLSGLVPFDKGLFDVCVPQDKVVGVVGSLSSDSTLAVASFFNDQRIPTISYAASSPDLDDKVNYPYFLRTVPSDEEQAIAMTQVIKTMGWEYVGLLYVDNNYGTKGAMAFRRVARQQKICVAEAVPISVNPTNVDGKHLYDAFIRLRRQDVRVVVFFGIDTRMADFLQLIESRNEQGNMIFIASEEWGSKPDVLAAGYKAARGSITFKVDNTYIDPAIEGKLRTRLLEKVPSPYDINPWFSEFWQHVFDCNILGGFNNIFSRNCQPNTRLAAHQVDRMLSDQRVKHVMNAVQAMAKGLADAKSQICEDVFPCAFLRSQKYAKEVFDSIKSQTVSAGSVKEQLFDSNGNGNIGFSIYNIQKEDDGYVYVPVGTYSKKNGLNLIKERLQFYTETGMSSDQWEATCVEDMCNTAECTFHSDDNRTSSPAGMTTDNAFRVADMVIIIVLVVVGLLILCCMCLGFKYFRQKVRGLSKDSQEQKAEPVYHMVQTTQHPTYGNVAPTQQTMLPLLPAASSRIQFANAQNSPSASPGHTMQGRTNPAFLPDTSNNRSKPSAVQNGTVPDPHRDSLPPPLPNRSSTPALFHSVSQQPQHEDHANSYDNDSVASQHNYYMTHTPSSARQLPVPPPPPPGSVSMATRSARSLQSWPERPESREYIPMHNLTPQHSRHGSIVNQQQYPDNAPEESGFPTTDSPSNDGNNIEYFRLTPSGQLQEGMGEGEEEWSGGGLMTYSLSPQEQGQGHSALDTLSSLSPEVAAQWYQHSPGSQDGADPPGEGADMVMTPTQYSGLVSAPERADSLVSLPYTLNTHIIPPLHITPQLREQLLQQLMYSPQGQQPELWYTLTSPHPRLSTPVASPSSARSQRINPPYRQQRSHPNMGFHPASVARSPPPAMTPNQRTGQRTPSEDHVGGDHRHAGGTFREGGPAQSMQTGVYAPISNLPHLLRNGVAVPQTVMSTASQQPSQTPESSGRGVLGPETAWSVGEESARSTLEASESDSDNSSSTSPGEIVPQPQALATATPQQQHNPQLPPPETPPQQQPVLMLAGEEQQGEVVTPYGMALNISRV